MRDQKIRTTPCLRRHMSTIPHRKTLRKVSHLHLNRVILVGTKTL